MTGNPRHRVPQEVAAGVQADVELSLCKAGPRQEIARRAPWLAISVAAGFAMMIIGESFEASLSQRIQLVFFLPTIVYMSDIIGTETLALVVRELAFRNVRLHGLVRRELLVGSALGAISGLAMALVSYAWLRDAALAITVGLAMCANGIIAVLLGLLVPVAFKRLRRDPAIGSDEILTALSDTISMTVYLAVASVILLA